MIKPAGTLEAPLRGIEGSLRETPCPPHYPMWCQKPSSATGWWWLRQMRREQEALAWQSLTLRRTSTSMMDSWRWTNRRGYRGRLMSFSASSARPACGQTQQRWLTWSASHATRQGGVRRQPMRDGWRVKAQRFGSASGCGWNTQSVEWKWQRACSWHIVRASMAWVGETGGDTHPPPPLNA